MAQVKIEDVLDHLDSEIGRALEDTIRQFAPDVTCNRGELLRFFQKRVYQHCAVWETVPDGCVKA